VDDGKPITVDEKFSYSTSIRFVPGTSKLAVSSGNNVAIWDIDAQKRTEVWPDKFPAGVLAIAFSPDGNRLAAAGGEIRIRDLKGESDRLRIPAADVTMMAYFPDGKQLAAVHQGAAGAALKIYDLGIGREVFSQTLAAGAATSFTISRDGRKIATASTGTADPLALVFQKSAAAVQPHIQIWDSTPPTTVIVDSPGEKPADKTK
jgi:WD40 repeat protein